jgi:tetratricopeptide (TPR) repeat protein
LKWYNELEKLDPSWPELPQMPGMVYIELKEYDKAIADLDVAIARDPKDKQLYQ